MNTSRARIWAAVAASAIGIGGCGLFGGFGSGNDDDDDDTAGDESIDGQAPGVPEARRQLSGCANGLDDAEIEETIQITNDFSDSAHEMVVCGGLVSSIVFALVEGVVELLQNPDASTLPEQYQWDGEGTYAVTSGPGGDLQMDVRFYLAQDFSFGSAGELVRENLFDVRSFLVNPRAQVETEITPQGLLVRVEIDHDGPGPLVELLGFGTEPPNPIVLDGGDLDFVMDQLAGLEVEATISFTDHPSVSTITYDIASPRMLARSLIDGTPLVLDMVSAAGARADLRQELEIHTWTVDYVDGTVGALDGDIGFTVRGDRFDFDALLHYPRDAWPDISLACAE